MDKNEKKNKNFIPPEEPEPCDNTIFDITSVASATECTGIGKVMPALSEFSDEDDGITDILDMYEKR